MIRLRALCFNEVIKNIAFINNDVIDRNLELLFLMSSYILMAAIPISSNMRKSEDNPRTPIQFTS